MYKSIKAKNIACEILTCYFNLLTDVSNQANLLLINLKEIIDNLQTERNYFKIQVEKLQSEKQQLIISNKNLSNKVDCLEEKMQTEFT